MIILAMDMPVLVMQPAMDIQLVHVTQHVSAMQHALVMWDATDTHVDAI